MKSFGLAQEEAMVWNNWKKKINGAKQGFTCKMSTKMVTARVWDTLGL